MAPRNPEKLAKKGAYLQKVKNLVRCSNNILIITADHVGSKQMQDIRVALRGKATVVMGKNTMIRFALNAYSVEYPDEDIAPLMSVVNGNMGFVFCKEGYMDEVRKIVLSSKVPAAAKAGVIAPRDVIIPAGSTGMDSSQTSFFQSLNIPTKIVKSQVEIVSDVHIIKKGMKVQASEQALLTKLNIKPFEYGLKISHFYENGGVFDSAVLDMTDEVIASKLAVAVSFVAAFSRQVNIPTEASVPHILGCAFKNCASLCAGIDYEFDQIAAFKQFLADPSKFASSAVAAAPSVAAPVAAATVEEPEEEEADMGFDLFD